MQTSASSSSGRPLPVQSNDSAKMIRDVLSAYESGNEKTRRKAGMGSMILVRTTNGEPTVTPLYDEHALKEVKSAWDRLKSFIVDRHDAASLYFHLHGVLFLMVPHVSANTPGEVEISLCSTNDPMNPVLQTQKLAFSDGPQAVMMTPDHTLPLQEGMVFYYQTCARETSARVPCSVLAFWRQTIERRTGSYNPVDTKKWMVKRLERAQFLRSHQQAKALLDQAYGTLENREISESTKSHIELLNEAVGLDVGRTQDDISGAFTELRVGRKHTVQIPRPQATQDDNFVQNVSKPSVSQVPPAGASMRFHPNAGRDAIVEEVIAPRVSVDDNGMSSLFPRSAMKRSEFSGFSSDSAPFAEDCGDFSICESDGPILSLDLLKVSQSVVEPGVSPVIMTSGEEHEIVGKDFGGLATHTFLSQASSQLSYSSDIFDFTQTTKQEEFVVVPIQQPALVSSRSPILIAKRTFSWEDTQQASTLLSTISLPEYINSNETMRTIGPRMLSFFDAAVLEFEAFVTLPRTAGANGELILLWDEGNWLDPTRVAINQATLVLAQGVRVSAFNMVESAEKKTLVFTPRGIGKFLPLDLGHEGARVGSLRVFVFNPLRTETTVKKFECTLNIYARVVATNIMQPPRLVSQFQGGAHQGSASFPFLPVNQLLYSKRWSSDMEAGTGSMLTFSPASLFMQNKVYQPSLLCNLACNCRWWTGTCVFEMKFNKTMFHSGIMVVAFGSVDSRVTNLQDMFNLSHAICDIKTGEVFRFSVDFKSWNGKNFLGSGRKESLPRPEHKARQRIFVAVGEKLQSTKPGLKEVGVTLVLKQIDNCELGGGLPIKPILGHKSQASSGADFLYSEFARLFEKKSQMSAREKFSFFSSQYLFRPLEKNAKRVLVVPCAPWSYQFETGSEVREVVTNPMINFCSSFSYWQGSLKYRLILHRKSDAIVNGGTCTILLENTGYPKTPGMYELAAPLATSGGLHWNFTTGTDFNCFTFEVPDDNFFERRYTRNNSSDAERSRLSPLADRHGNLLIYLPEEDVFHFAELQVCPGEDFNFSQTHAPVAALENSVGSMDGSIYELVAGSDGKYKPDQ